MPLWQTILVAWVGLWALQSVGVWYQMRRYRAQLHALQTEYSSGYIGTGYSPRRLARGAIVMMVTNNDLVIKKFMLMRGATILAPFRELCEYEGLSFDQLGQKLADEPKKSSLKAAAENAMAQIQRVKKDRESPKKEGSEMAHA
jgi:glucitol operon activator protein